MNYQKLLDRLRHHPGNRDNRQRRVALLVLKVCRKIRLQGGNPTRGPTTKESVLEVIGGMDRDQGNEYLDALSDQREGSGGSSYKNENGEPVFG